MLLGLLRAPYAAQRNYTAQIVEQAHYRIFNKGVPTVDWILAP